MLRECRVQGARPGLRGSGDDEVGKRSAMRCNDMATILSKVERLT